MSRAAPVVPTDAIRPRGCGSLPQSARGHRPAGAEGPVFGAAVTFRASPQARLAAYTSDDPARRAATTFRTRSKPPPTVPQQAARWVRTRVRRLRTTAEALDLNRICDLWHAYLGPAAAQGSGPALARRRRPIASRQLSLARGCRRAHLSQGPSPPIARCSAAPLRPSRAARRRDGCRGGDCVIVCVYCVWGNAGNAGDAGTRGVHLTSRVQEML